MSSVLMLWGRSCPSCQGPLQPWAVVGFWQLHCRTCGCWVAQHPPVPILDYCECCGAVTDDGRVCPFCLAVSES